MKPKLVVILGQTATGKSDLGVELAKAFDGEVISADSRQVYKGMDLGSGKITPEEMQGIPHHMLDIADPNTVYSAGDFQRDAFAAINDIISRGKTPILVGGTGFYIQMIVDNTELTEVKPNKELRKELEKMANEELYEILKEKAPQRAEEIDEHNKHRLVRSLEIYDALGEIPKATAGDSKFDVLQIGLELPKKELVEKIEKRIDKRLEEGMIEEVERLHKEGVSWERLESLGLEYRHIAEHLQGKKDLEEMKYVLGIKTRQFAKRQLTWLKRDSRVEWFDPSQQEEVFSKVKTFLEN
jgi:tRNA dimethylallyltransferase